MTSPELQDHPPEARRKEIFEALVAVQDTGKMSVPESRKAVAKQFGVTETVVRQIEHEGLDREWPPL